MKLGLELKGNSQKLTSICCILFNLYKKKIVEKYLKFLKIEK